MAGKKGKKKRFQQINQPKTQQARADLNQPAVPAAAINAAAPVTTKAPTARATTAGKSISAATKTISHEFFASDLKRIGILTAVIIVILIILGIVLK
jgi:hypothetical protein